MFWLKWAYKNLVINKKRTAGLLIFISSILIIFIVDLMFIEGTSSQMKESIRNNRGDLNSFARGLNHSVSPVYKYLNQKYKKLIEDNIKIYDKNVQLIGTINYSNGRVIGTESKYLKYLARNVSWEENLKQNLNQGTTIVESNLAKRLNLKRGDYLTVQIRTEVGMINTLSVVVDGIFIGSNLLYKDIIFINLEDMNQLFLEKDHFNEVRTYFKPGVTDAEITNVLKDLTKKFFTLAVIESLRLDPTKESVFYTFGYYRYFTVFIFYMLNTVFIFVLYFAVQNIFFMNFRKRRQEISTLLTFGLKPSRLKSIVLWEASIIFAVSFLIAVILSQGIINILRNFSINDPSISDIIVALGGPRLCFANNHQSVLILLGITFLVVIYSSYKSLNSYLKMEIHEIISKE